ncbi:MAG TPA: helix-hairpin-helix domain-containing protein [Bacteroidales bacterium]|nr:helix-hairpin-helix domain-containing protein [Bacteroidales bacterium]
MKRYKKTLLLIFFNIFFICSCTLLKAQEVEPDSTIDEQQIEKIENYSEQTGAEIDYSDLLSDLEYFIKHPVNINTADFEELAELKILTDIQINNLIEHIRKNGKLLSIYELQSVQGFDNEIITHLLPYITIGLTPEKSSFNLKEMVKFGKNDLFIRYQRVLEKQDGYIDVPDSVYALSPNSHYLGSPDKIYAKYRFNYYNKVLLGFTAEKDAGEQFFKGINRYGFDYYSGFINVRNIGILKNIVLGDFNVQFGQGLTLWTGLSFGKSSEAANIKKLARGISPYSSAYESGFMRGAGFTLGIKNFELTGFYSYKNIDASVSGSDTMEYTDYVITSITEDGLHNTLSKADKKKAISEQVFGGHLAYKTKALNIGVTAYGMHLGAPLMDMVKPYNTFEFRGQNNFNIGIDYSYIVRNFNIFGETARSQNGGIATFNGIMASLDRYVSFVVAHRYYQRTYQSMFTSPFGESGNPYNETGFYTGIAIKPHYKILINAFADFYSFPWLKYLVNSPSNGFDCNVSLQYKPTKKITINLRYKFENKYTVSDDEEAAIDYNIPYSRQNYRFHISYPVSGSFTFANRVEVSRYKKNSSDPEYGYLIYQDIRYKTSKSPLSFSLRFALFDTKSYNSRMYAYENDVLYAYSIPMFYDKGIRYYLMLKYRLGRHIDIWLRFAQTFYDNKTAISSGLNEINGNKQSEIKAQVRFKF